MEKTLDILYGKESITKLKLIIQRDRYRPEGFEFNIELKRTKLISPTPNYE
jgi:hypothetical protein